MAISSRSEAVPPRAELARSPRPESPSEALQLTQAGSRTATEVRATRCLTSACSLGSLQFNEPLDSAQLTSRRS